MKKHIFVSIVMLGTFLLAGCASQQTEITRQDLADALAVISTAKILGAQEVAPDEIAQAEHYYKLALDDFNQAPKGRLGAYLSERKSLETSASEKAQQAKSQAERALLIIKSQESRSTDVNAELQMEADELKIQLAQLEREKELLLQEKASASMVLPAPVPVAAPKDCLTEARALYNQAFYLFQTRRYDQARATFERYRELYSDNLSDNAQFWIAECYFMQQQYDPALTAFQKLLSDFPQSNKTADTLLSIGLCLNRLNKREDAIQNWMTVVKTYPESTAADYARKFLEMP